MNDSSRKVPRGSRAGLPCIRKDGQREGGGAGAGAPKHSCAKAGMPSPPSSERRRARGVGGDSRCFARLQPAGSRSRDSPQADCRRIGGEPAFFSLGERFANAMRERLGLAREMLRRRTLPAFTHAETSFVECAAGGPDISRSEKTGDCQTTRASLHAAPENWADRKRCTAFIAQDIMKNKKRRYPVRALRK